MRISLALCMCQNIHSYISFRAASVLAQVEPSLVELLAGRDLVLPFSGISHFRKEVVFVGLAPGEHRHRLDTVAGQGSICCSLLYQSVVLFSFVLFLPFVKVCCFK